MSLVQDLKRKQNYERIVTEGTKIYKGKDTYEKLVGPTSFYSNSCSKDSAQFKNTRIIVTCSLHGDFETDGNLYINRKIGCPKCSSKYQPTEEEFRQMIENIYGKNVFDLSVTQYTHSQNPVKLKCAKCGTVWSARVNTVLKKNFYIEKHPENGGKNEGTFCPVCFPRKRVFCNTEIFIKKAQKIHGKKYDYSRVKYINNTQKVDIVCPDHGVFRQTPMNHLCGQCCPKCRRSIGEELIEEYCTKNNIPFETEKTFPDCVFKQKVRFDFYLPTYNLLIEFQGKQHENTDWFVKVQNFSPEKAQRYVEVQKARDQVKKDFCKKKGIILLELFNRQTVEQDLDNFLKDKTPDLNKEHWISFNPDHHKRFKTSEEAFKSTQEKVGKNWELSQPFPSNFYLPFTLKCKKCETLYKRTMQTLQGLRFLPGNLVCPTCVFLENNEGKSTEEVQPKEKEMRYFKARFKEVKG